MTLEQMEAFITISRHLSFTKASEILFTSQSNLSRMITALESELNMQLFIRGSRSVRLTPAGLVLYQEFSKVYEQVKAGIAQARDVNLGKSGKINMGILEENTQITNIIEEVFTVMSSNQLYDQRLERIRKAVRCEPVDQIPVAPCGNAYFARRQNVLMREYITDFDKACTANLAELTRLDADATQNVIFSPYLLGTQWLSKTALPGIELGDDEMWQVTETENMKFEEYEDIKEMGWDAWQKKFIAERCNNNWENLKPFFAANPDAYRRFHEAGIPCICDFLMITPFEYFCGGRALENFFADDLLEEPELMHEIFDLVLAHNLKAYRQQIVDTHALGAWIGGWRTGPDLVSPSMFDEFVWPAFQAYYELCIDTGIIPIFHLDSNWDLCMDRFKRLEDKTYVIALDSKTNIRRAREILGPNVCILGDVPCELMTFGTSEEVADYVTKLLDDIGPWGCIIAAGCDIPSDAKPENVKAMCDAAHRYLNK